MSTYAKIQTLVLLGSGPVSSPTGQAVSGTNTYSSNPIDVGSISWATFDIRWASSPTGTLAVQESLDGSTWYSLPAGAITNPSLSSPAGSGGSECIHVQCRGTNFLRVTYTNSTGSGTLLVMAHANGMG